MKFVSLSIIQRKLNAELVNNEPKNHSSVAMFKLCPESVIVENWEHFGKLSKIAEGTIN